MDTNIEGRLMRDRAPGRAPRAARVALGIGIGLYLLVMGGLTGTLVERIRFDHRRDAALARYGALLRARNAGLMAIERDVAQRFGPPRGDQGPVSLGMRATTTGN